MSEKKYLKSLAISTIALIIVFIVSMVIGIKAVFDTQNINAYIFELLYAAFHLIVLGLAIGMIIIAIKNGSFFIKGLMTDNGGRIANKKGQIVALVLSSICLLICIYFTLVLFKIPLPYFNFPKILVLLIINVCLFVCIYGVYFFLYPLIVKNKK